MNVLDIFDLGPKHWGPFDMIGKGVKNSKQVRIDRYMYIIYIYTYMMFIDFP